jgi:excisionase family DNA binding protein
MQATSLGTAITVSSGLFTPAISNGARKPMADDHDIMRVKEICDLLRLHRSTVYKLIRQDKIPRFRVGNEWRFRRDVIECGQRLTKPRRGANMASGYHYKIGGTEDVRITFSFIPFLVRPARSSRSSRNCATW